MAKSLPSAEANLAATEQPPEPPPTTTTLYLLDDSFDFGWTEYAHAWILGITEEEYEFTIFDAKTGLMLWKRHNLFTALQAISANFKSIRFVRWNKKSPDS